MSRKDALVLHIPDLFTVGGNLLYVGAHPGRFDFSNELSKIFKSEVSEMTEDKTISLPRLGMALTYSDNLDYDASGNEAVMNTAAIGALFNKMGERMGEIIPPRCEITIGFKLTIEKKEYDPVNSDISVYRYVLTPANEFREKGRED